MPDNIQRRRSTGAGDLKHLAADVAPNPTPEPEDKYLLITNDSKTYSQSFKQIKQMIIDKLTQYKERRMLCDEQSDGFKKALMINTMATKIEIAPNARVVMDTLKISMENENILLNKHRNFFHIPRSNPKSKSVVRNCHEDADYEFSNLLGLHSTAGLGMMGNQ